MHWFTIIYALNQLEQRIFLWKNIENVNQNKHGLWCMIGEFNNVLKTHDMVGGNMVREGEYVDMPSMMEKTRLFEIESVGDYTHGLIRMLRA